MYSSTSCAICRDFITDPVCMDCYIKQTQVLLNDLQLDPIINDFISDKLERASSDETVNNDKCILCNKEYVTLCRYCFTVTLVNILRELNCPEDIVEVFDYDPTYGEISANTTIYGTLAY